MTYCLTSCPGLRELPSAQQPSRPPRQMPRSTRGWVRVGREYEPEAVGPCRAFHAPQLHYLLMWCGGTNVDDCAVLSCPQYEVMNTETAFKMCAAGKGGGFR